MTSRMRFGQTDNAGVANWGKIAAALILTRHLSGSEENLEIDPENAAGAWSISRPRIRALGANLLLSSCWPIARSATPEVAAGGENAADPLQARAGGGPASDECPLVAHGPMLRPPMERPHCVGSQAGDQRQRHRMQRGLLSLRRGRPSELPKLRFMWNICCPGNGNQVLYHAWEAIVRCKEGNAQVHLLLNRASPWLDIDSYLGRTACRSARIKVAERWQSSGRDPSAERQKRERWGLTKCTHRSQRVTPCCHTQSESKCVDLAPIGAIDDSPAIHRRVSSDEKTSFVP